MTVAYLEKLNEQQRQAVEHGVGLADGQVAGPLLIIAGAGSGKTNTLAHRVAHLIVNGADPRRILLMTFSRRAASEMARRVERICKQVLGANSGVLTDALSWSGTFHGIGARLLRIYAEQIGLNVDFTIHDREDSADLMNLARHELGFSKTESRFPTKGTCLSIYSRAVNSQSPLNEILRQHYPWVATWEEQLKQLFAAYVEAKQAQNVLDYDDLLLYWAQMVSDPDLADDVGNRFDHVMVDEYQDTNVAQYLWLRLLAQGSPNICCVGDDDQSIYGWRGAEVDNILRFEKDFPGAKVIRLERNYRSTANILAAASGLIAKNKDRLGKTLFTDGASGAKIKVANFWDDEAEARAIGEDIENHQRAQERLNDMAVLVRASSQMRAIEDRFITLGLPYSVIGVRSRSSSPAATFPSSSSAV